MGLKRVAMWGGAAERDIVGFIWSCGEKFQRIRWSMRLVGMWVGAGLFVLSVCGMVFQSTKYTGVDSFCTTHVSR